MPSLAVVVRVLLAALTLAAAVTDWRSRRIPNWLVAPALAAGFAVNGILFGWGGLAEAAKGAGVAMLVYIPLYLIRAMGGGDVKLMLAVGSLAGPRHWLVIFVLTAILGGVIAILVLATRGAVRNALRNVWHIVASLVLLRAPYTSKPELDIADPKAITLPHGVAIALGTWLYVAVMSL
ncbi:MAG: prepilin peptidase [Acidobacteria bacterium]|nr:prepilin peptidase [Acidobacteriota bacterium]MBI3279904.1 prepilin peptidase [Acidobacteriota bacterium]